MDHDESREEIRARLAARLREACEARKVSVAQLAVLSGISRNHLFGILGGRKSPTVDYLARIARALELEPGTLLGTRAITARTKRVQW